MSIFVNSWWTMFVHLVLSIVGIPEFNKMEFSMDTLSDTVLLVKYAIFLVLGIILLKNMLISVLGHTYQQTQVRFVKEQRQGTYIWQKENSKRVT